MDDVVIWASANNNNKQQIILEKTMNHSLEVLNSWAAENNMIIDKLKTMYQYFSLQHNVADFSLKIDDQMLQKSASTKYLGVLLDSKLNWADHISKIVEKTNKRLGFMKMLAGATWGNTKDTLNVTYVKPVMKYDSEVIDTTNKANLNHLKTAQNNTQRLICGAVKTTPVTALHLYTENLPVSLEIQKQAAASFIKLRASSQASWINQHTPHQTLKTQPTLLNVKTS